MGNSLFAKIESPKTVRLLILDINAISLNDSQNNPINEEDEISVELSLLSLSLVDKKFLYSNASVICIQDSGRAHKVIQLTKNLQGVRLEKF